MNRANTSTGPATDAHQIGRDLHDLIAALEPARWHEASRSELRAGFERAARNISALVDRRGEANPADPVVSRLEHIARLIEHQLPGPREERSRWMEFRARVHPAYEELAETIGHAELPSLRPTNYARSAFHVLTALVALLLVEYAPWWLAAAVPISLASLFWFLEATRRISDAWNARLMRFFKHIAHPHERYRVNSSTWYATALSLLALTGEPVAFASGVVVLGLGDPAAALVGRRFGRVELVNGRTLEGSATFVLVSFAAVMAVLAIWHADYSLATRIAISAASAVTGALAELICRRIDDNFAIPVAAGATAWLMLVWI